MKKGKKLIKELGAGFGRKNENRRLASRLASGWSGWPDQLSNLGQPDQPFFKRLDS
jgi:hypothetical protein